MIKLSHEVENLAVYGFILTWNTLQRRMTNINWMLVWKEQPEGAYSVRKPEQMYYAKVHIFLVLPFGKLWNQKAFKSSGASRKCIEFHLSKPTMDLAHATSTYLVNEGKFMIKGSQHFGETFTCKIDGELCEMNCLSQSVSMSRYLFHSDTFMRRHGRPKWHW